VGGKRDEELSKLILQKCNRERRMKDREASTECESEKTRKESKKLKKHLEMKSTTWIDACVIQRMMMECLTVKRTLQSTREGPG
jgi:hypothetical protein